MRVVVGSCMKTYLGECIVQELVRRGYQVKLLGAFIRDDVSINSVIEGVVNAILCEGYDEGILICWNDIEAVILLNKNQKIRAIAYTEERADIGEVKKWEGANILVLSPRLVSEAEIYSVLECWFSISLDTHIKPSPEILNEKLEINSMMKPTSQNINIQISKTVKPTLASIY